MLLFVDFFLFKKKKIIHCRLYLIFFIIFYTDANKFWCLFVVCAIIFQEVLSFVHCNIWSGSFFSHMTGQQ